MDSINLQYHNISVQKSFFHLWCRYHQEKPKCNSCNLRSSENQTTVYCIIYTIFMRVTVWIQVINRNNDWNNILYLIKEHLISCREGANLSVLHQWRTNDTCRSTCCCLSANWNCSRWPVLFQTQCPVSKLC